MGQVGSRAEWALPLTAWQVLPLPGGGAEIAGLTPTNGKGQDIGLSCLRRMATSSPH